MMGRPSGLSRRQCPRLRGLREEAIDGRYALTLEFENRNGMTEEQWKEREGKFATFFGPGITAEVRRCCPSALRRERRPQSPMLTPATPGRS